jgi:site-specific DNA-methyltransferase (adenine-specific)
MAANIAVNIDCMEYMKNIPNNYFDLAVVDPPYGLPKDSSNGRGKLKTRVFNSGNIKVWDVKPKESYFQELFRVSKNQIIFGGNYFTLGPCRCFIVWDKMQPWENFSRCEYAWTSFNLPSKLFAYDNRKKGKIHPTQKPVALYKWIFDKFANPGDKILDTHLGSGSSRIAAYNAGLDFVGCEIDKYYYEAQEKRFKEYTAQMRLGV